MRSILHGLLVFSITLVYVIGSQVTVELEHSHEVHAEHGHRHVETGSKPEHHPHDHGDSQDHDHQPVHSPDHHDDGEHGNEHHHSHLVTVVTDAPISCPNYPRIGLTGWSTVRTSLPGPDSCEDGPCFPLIKPPQLG